VINKNSSTKKSGNKDLISMEVGFFESLRIIQQGKKIPHLSTRLSPKFTLKAKYPLLKKQLQLATPCLTQ